MFYVFVCMRGLSINPREYQRAIFGSVKDVNSLVVLPTGTGKTLIAMMVAEYKFCKEPLKKIVIMAPTRPLIEQHLESFKKNFPEGWADMQLFTGKTNAEKRKEIWQTAEFIFSTPQCINNDITKELYDLKDVSLLIIDEAHRCLKNYSYNKIAMRYKMQNDNGQILALTASPGGDKKTIEDVCSNMNVQKVEVRTRLSPDVKPYLQELEFEKIFVDFPPEFMEIKSLLDGIYDDKLSELKQRKILFGYANKIMLLKVQNRLMSEIRKHKDGNSMIGVSLCAQALKISHAIELVETQTIDSLVEYMREMYKQASENQSRAVKKLTSDPRFSKAYTLALTLNKEHPKLYELKKIISDALSENQNSKIIVFAQFRETINKIKDFLGDVSNARVGIFVGQAMKENTQGVKTGLKQKEQQAMVEQFKRGDVNILVATSIAEEGLDIPEVSLVVFYEPVPSAIRKIQRSGRTARLSPGQLKVLITKSTRDEVYYYSSYNKEKKMHKVIDEIQKNGINVQKKLE